MTHFSQTHRMMDFPHKSARGFPGKREDSYLAGITTTNSLSLMSGANMNPVQLDNLLALEILRAVSF